MEENILYGRISGVPNAIAAGGIEGWVCYREDGPAGLDPSRYYVLNPSVKRPTAYFMPCTPSSPSFYEAYVDEGFATDTFMTMSLKPRSDILNIITYDAVVINAPEAPKAVFINGNPTAFNPVPETKHQWKVSFQLTGPITICVILKDLPAGFSDLATHAISRDLGIDWAIDQKLPAGAESFTTKANTLSCKRGAVLVPVRAPTDQGAGTLNLSVSRSKEIKDVTFNGMELSMTMDSAKKAKVSIPMKAGEQGLLALHTGVSLSLTFDWEPLAQKSVE